MKKTFLFFGFILMSLFSLAQSTIGGDLGNGYFSNPVSAGRYGDPTVCRVGEDYYMTHSGGGNPCLLIWHSKDLVNWQPLDYAVHDFFESIWAPELVYHDGKFYIYTTMVSTQKDGKSKYDNYVIVSDRPDGRWSKPINLNVSGFIDPGHVSDDKGNRYLYFDKGNMIKLSADGLKTEGTISKVYDGWVYPEEWVEECFCLEGPKFFKKGDYYYLVSAQGGTTGPSTSHMAVVARSKSPTGPWENSPINPLIRTKNREEKWWSQGHATIINAPDGSCWAIFHAYQNGFKTLGRPTFLLPVQWTADGWPIVNENAQSILKKPIGKPVKHYYSLSDEFEGPKPGVQWRTANAKMDDVFSVENKTLKGSAFGNTLHDSNRIFCLASDKSYEITAEIESSTEVEAGLALHSNALNFVGISIKNKIVSVNGPGRAKRPTFEIGQNKVYFKLRNVQNDVSFFWSSDGNNWKKYPNSFEVSAFERATITLFGMGSGEFKVKNFKYLPLNF